MWDEGADAVRGGERSRADAKIEMVKAGGTSEVE